jgi:hypothetical protein
MQIGDETAHQYRCKTRENKYQSENSLFNWKRLAQPETITDRPVNSTEF